MAEVKKINGYTLNDETSRANIGCNADTYSNSRTYNVGDIVVYNKQIHKCKTAVTAAEAFDSKKWQQICLRDLVIGLKEELADRTETFSLELFAGYEISNGFTGNMICRRFGKVVTAYFSGTIKAGDLAFIKLDRELPEEFWPLQDVLIKAHTKETDSFSFYINADGKATGANMGNVYNNGETDVNIKAVATYIVDSGSSGSQDIQVSEEFIEETLAAIEILNQENVDQQEKIDALMKDYDKKEVSGESIHINDSLEYDMPISINGGIEQDTREGYNKCESKLTSLTNNGITMTRLSNGKYLLNGTSTGTAGFRIDQTDNGADNLKDYNGTYTLSIRTSSNNNDITARLIKNEPFEQLAMATSSKTATVTIDKTGCFIMINMPTGITLNNEIVEIMLLEGTYTTDTLPEFEQYGAMPSLAFPSEVKGVSGHYDTVVENKQLLNLSIKDQVPSISTGELVAYAGGVSSDFTRINAKNKYIYSYELVNVGVTTPQYIFFYDKDKKLLGYVNPTQNYILNDSEYFAQANYIKGRVDFISRLKYAQLEVGEVATSNIAHQEQLLPIDIPFTMYSGKPYKENGKWYVDKKWEKYILTGNETISKNEEQNRFVIDGNFKYYFNISSSKRYEAYCNFEKIVKSTGTETANGMGLYQKYIFWRNDKKFTDMTVEELKTWLQEQYANGTPVYVVYKLAEPYEEEITDETLISQLEALEKAQSYDGVTNVNSYGNEDAAPLVLSGEYVRSNKIRIENLEKAILSLGGNV